MVSLLTIGFGLLVLGVRLMMVRHALHWAGPVPLNIANQVRTEGLVISIVGAVVLLVYVLFGIVWRLLLNGEAQVLRDTGGVIMILGLSQLVQWAVQSGHGTEHCVCVGAWVATLIGVALVLVYAIYRIVAIVCK